MQADVQVVRPLTADAEPSLPRASPLSCPSAAVSLCLSSLPNRPQVVILPQTPGSEPNLTSAGPGKSCDNAADPA